MFLCRHSILTFSPSEGGPCDPVRPWRMADGSCNNLDNPLWGGETNNVGFQYYPHNHHPCHCQPPTPPSSGSCCPSTVTGCGRARSSQSRAPGCPPPDWSVIKTKYYSPANNFKSPPSSHLRSASTSCPMWTPPVSWTPTT